MAANNSNPQMTNSNNTPDMSSVQTDSNHSPAHLTDIDYGLTTPAASEDNTSSSSGNSSDTRSNGFGLTFPITPECNTSVCSGNNTAVFPNFSAFPSCPNCSASASYGQVRFLNASTNNFSVNIAVDTTSYASNLSFGTITNYNQISDGFHTVTVRRSSGLRTTLLQQTFPFSANEKYTMVLVDSSQGGLNIVQVGSTSCNNINSNIGCYRVANMAYSGSSFDVMLYSRDSVFRNVNFQEVTSYKQAMAGSYQFYITNANNFTVIRELPILVIGAVSTGNLSNNPLVSYQIDISGRTKYTSYLIGNTWSNNNFRVLTVED